MPAPRMHGFEGCRSQASLECKMSSSFKGGNRKKTGGKDNGKGKLWKCWIKSYSLTDQGTLQQLTAWRSWEELPVTLLSYSCHPESETAWLQEDTFSNYMTWVPPLLSEPIRRDLCFVGANSKPPALLPVVLNDWVRTQDPQDGRSDSHKVSSEFYAHIRTLD